MHPAPRSRRRRPSSHGSSGQKPVKLRLGKLMIGRVLATKMLVGTMLVALLVLTGCGGDNTTDTEVLGVSVVTSSIGKTRISVLGSGVNVALLEADAPSTIALARDGEIVTMSDVAPGTDLSLNVDEPGTYDVLGIELQEAASSDGTELAPAQTVTRLGTVEID